MKNPARALYRSIFFLTVSLSLAFAATACQVVSIIPAESQPATTSASDTPWFSGIFGDLFDDEVRLGRSGPQFPVEPSTVEMTTSLTTETTAAETTAETTAAPTTASTIAPTIAPTTAPTAAPTAVPTPKPTPKPTAVPTPKPTAAPTPVPTTAPTAAPTPNPKLCIINLPGVPSNPIPYNASQQAKIDGFLALVNSARADAKLSPLSVGNSSMQQMAAIRSAEISVLFSHSRPTDDINSRNWSDLLSGLNISYMAAGENITGIDNETGPNTYVSAMNVLMNSTGHRANILGASYTKIAIGIYTDPKTGKDWYVQEFFG